MKENKTARTNDIYRHAIDAYGAELQCVVAIEELSELQKEICKMLRGNGNLDHLAEEIADAKIMIEQVTMIFGANDASEEWRKKKLTRLMERTAWTERANKGAFHE